MQKNVGVENLDDRALLPKKIYPNLAKQPFFKGEGMHGVRELETVCKEFKEYCHQQAIIKQELLKRLGWTDLVPV
jgi:hypothetical protein